jgi:hypothetical protein
VTAQAAVAALDKGSHRFDQVPLGAVSGLDTRNESRAL